MKKLIIFAILAIVAIAYAGVITDPLPVGDKVVLDENRYAEKLDDANLQITTTYTQRREKRELLEEKQRFQDEITHLESRIAEIDKLLTVWK